MGLQPGLGGPVFWWGLILGVSLLVYWPSFSQIARSDHYAFILRNPLDVGIWNYLVEATSYPRAKGLNPGIFRPLYNFLLAFENLVFGSRNFLAYQIVGYSFHLLALLGLWRVLHLIHPSVLSKAFVLLFSVFFISQEAVTWAAVNANVLGVALVLFALERFLRLTHQKGSFGLYLLPMSLALFVNEVFFVFPFVFFLWNVCLTKKFLSSGVFLLPAVFYLVLNALDYWFYSDMAYTTRAGITQLAEAQNHFSPILTLQTSGWLALNWLSAGFFPTLHSMHAHEQAVWHIPYEWKSFWGLHRLNFFSVGTLLLVGLFLFSLGRVFFQTLREKSLSFLSSTAFFPLVGAFLITLPIAIGRLNKNITYARHVNYHSYLFWSLVLVALVACIALLVKDSQRWRPVYRRAVQAILFLIISVWTLGSGVQARWMNSEMAAFMAPTRQMVEKIEAFFASYPKSEDLKFEFMSRLPGDLPRYLGRIDKYYQLDRTLYLSDILFPGKFGDQPDVLLSVDSRGEIVPVSQLDPNQPRPVGSLRNYNRYFYQGRYYGVDQSKDRLLFGHLPDLKMRTHVPEAETLAGLDAWITNSYENLGLKKMKSGAADRVEIRTNRPNGVKNVLDQNIDNMWEFIHDAEVWLEMFFAKSKRIEAYILRTGNDGIEGRDARDRMIDTWMLQGSLDGKNWDIVDQRRGEKDWASYEARVFQIEPQYQYPFWRLTVLSPNRKPRRIYGFALVEEYLR